MRKLPSQLVLSWSDLPTHVTFSVPLLPPTPPANALAPDT